MGRVRQVSLDPRRTKRVFECLYYHGKDLCMGCREMACSTLSHLRGHRNMPWERRSADTRYPDPPTADWARSRHRLRVMRSASATVYRVHSRDGGARPRARG